MSSWLDNINLVRVNGSLIMHIIWQVLTEFFSQLNSDKDTRLHYLPIVISSLNFIKILKFTRNTNTSHKSQLRTYNRIPKILISDGIKAFLSQNCNQLYGRAKNAIVHTLNNKREKRNYMLYVALQQRNDYAISSDTVLITNHIKQTNNNTNYN